MRSCCQDILHPKTIPAKGTFTVALAGNPNCGKTTLFNALTGLRQRVANYPGVTVEKKTGRCDLPDGRSITIIDLPGTYSLISRSPDEVVAMEVLRGLRADTPAPDAVIVVVDASNLQRNLYLVSQLIELGRPLVVALNMMDIARRRGIDVSPELLEKELGVPVVAVVAHKRDGIEALRAAILQARVAPMPDWPLPHDMKEELSVVGGALAILDHDESTGPDGHVTSNADFDAARRLGRYQALAERLLIGDSAPDLGEISARQPVSSLLRSSRSRLAAAGVDPMQADIEAHYRWIEGVTNRVSTSLDELAAMGNPSADGTLHYETPRRRHFSDRLDAVLVHKIWGLAIFALIMASLFVTIFWLAAPIMDGIKGGFDAVGSWIAGKMSQGPLKDLVKDGIFAGVGAVVVFVPQIALLFLFLGILEDSGYLARAAFLMDRLLAKVGLHGKSFIPLLSSFACAIPGIMATRTIEDRKSRLATILVAPFMSCSARLPVYTLLIGTFFASSGAVGQAGIMLALYAAGIIAAAVTAWFFKRSLLKGPTPAFILELPTYKLPQFSQVTRHVLTNTWEFLAKAGTTIFVLSVILWAMTYYPHFSREHEETLAVQFKQAQVEKDRAEFAAKSDSVTYRLAPEREKEIDEAAEKHVGAEQIRHSIAGHIGRAIEPVIRPLGYDWKIGVGLVGAFAAREVFVSTMGIIYSVGDVGDETTDISKAMEEDVHPDGTKVWGKPVAASLLVWFVLAMQCMSTLAIVRRETGGWKWPLFLLAYMNALAYVVCLGVYQVARLVWA